MLVKQKKSLMFFILLIFTYTVIMGIFGINVLRSAYSNEIYTVQNIAGKVIGAYPETENVFAEAVVDSDRQYRKMGADILSHYGYDEDEKIEENISYIRIRFYLIVMLLVFCVFSIMLMYIFLYMEYQQVKKEQEDILSILDNCLSDDYKFINNTDRLKRLDNPLFASILVKLGNKLKLKTEQLKEEQDNTKVLVTDISHQLKTPVSALGACFDLYTETDDDGDKEEFYERCKMQINKIEILVHDLIQISRLENKMIVLTTEPLSLLEILAGAVNTVYYKAQNKNIRIETEEFDDLCLKLDKKWTIEAFANILDNSIKYSPENAKISIRVQKLYQYVRVEIEDNGIGISKEEQNKIFRRFYRGSNAAVRNEDGSGVGLYLTRKILEDEEGTIFVRSSENRGSTFCVNLLITE